MLDTGPTLTNFASTVPLTGKTALSRSFERNEGNGTSQLLSLNFRAPEKYNSKFIKPFRSYNATVINKTVTGQSRVAIAI